MSQLTSPLSSRAQVGRSGASAVAPRLVDITHLSSGGSGILPIRFSPIQLLEFRQLAKVHCTFAHFTVNWIWTENFLSATLMSVSYDIPIPMRWTWALTYILYWYCLVTTGKVHLTFANTPPGVSPIGESLLYFRQYIRGLSPLANVLSANVPPPVQCIDIRS
jgi:hypothetical protein